MNRVSAIRHGVVTAVRRLALSLFVAWAVSGGIPSTVLVAKGVYTLTTNVSDWFEPYRLTVPTWQHGQNVYLFYGRRIHRPFWGTYTVRVVKLHSPEPPVCDNSETIPYKPLETSTPLIAWSLDKFVGEPCNLSPGWYRIEVSWIVRIPWRFDEVVSLQSNEFEIRER